LGKVFWEKLTLKKIVWDIGQRIGVGTKFIMRAEQQLKASLKEIDDLKARTGRARHSRHHRPAGNNHLCQRQVLRDFEIFPQGIAMSSDSSKRQY